MKKICKLVICLLALLVLFCSLLLSGCGESKSKQHRGAKNSYEARVLWAHDGDTVTVQDRKQVKHKLRLYAIDAPELAQSGGKESLKNLQRIMPKQVWVRVEVENKDRYGREVATIYYRDLNVNRQQVADGHAWHYKQYDKTFNEEYDRLERQAREQRLGLWHYPNAKAPWDYRKAKRQKKAKA